MRLYKKLTMQMTDNFLLGTTLGLFLVPKAKYFIVYILVQVTRTVQEPSPWANQNTEYFQTTRMPVENERSWHIIVCTNMI